MEMTFEERCRISEASLPDADYRKMLEKLHREMLTALQDESARIDWLEEEAKSSRTGITASWMNRSDASPLHPGYRLMRFHKVFDAKPTLREAIDSAMLG